MTMEQYIPQEKIMKSPEAIWLRGYKHIPL